jgi:nitrite reductase/ring-hydroxylating ferredoxin subunit
VSDQDEISRRNLLMRLGIMLNAAAAAILAIPIAAYLISPLLREKDYLKWISLGSIDRFPRGQTRLATFRNPFARPGDGETDDIPCWVRHENGGTFKVFAVNCAHLGCPVRWFPQSGLFMCPCHGGIYYADGSRAAGPPPRGLFQYPWKVEGNQLMIRAGQLPTLSTQADLMAGRRKTCV